MEAKVGGEVMCCQPHLSFETLFVHLQVNYASSDCQCSRVCRFFCSFFSHFIVISYEHETVVFIHFENAPGKVEERTCHSGSGFWMS